MGARVRAPTFRSRASGAVITTESLIAGALLGVHAGDSLGASLEFMSFGQVREAYPDGLREIVGGGPPKRCATV